MARVCGLCISCVSLFGDTQTEFWLWLALELEQNSISKILPSWYIGTIQTTTRGTTMTPLDQFKEQGKWASFHHAADGPGETQQAYACEAKAMELYRDNPADREAMREEAKDFLWSASFERKADAIDIELPQVYRELGLTTRKNEKGYIWLEHSGMFVDLSIEMRDIELAASHFASGWFAGRKAQRGEK